MDISSYVLLSHEQALRRRMDVVSNNLANMTTVGFKREQPLFHEYMQETDSIVRSAQTTSFVLDYGTVHDTSNGVFQPTGNPLDVMIDGPGFLAVEAPNGETAYTRAGFIKVLESGELVTSGGQKILGEGGQTIAVPPDQAANLSITEDGTVMGKDGPLGRIAVTVFDNEGSVDPRGDGLFNGAGGRELAANETKLVSGGVEGSNVNPISETTDMIEILRAYQASKAMSDQMSDMRKRAIERLGRPGA
ncbi:flagellar hook-basal body complex protein [Stakelama tenebrarum]|uniref:Flagellar hook-basal body complex protein n=1 Tax=Stakelama tenebrarum TaxID=2711215 RepID=A0A6G6Y436_9SPHN|nr:flagellar hook-basal body complex protein [Sphingosinithalassobacter tenebrarum]QIG79675.1 flagellar hook-basal body complex protein [Sphingosinithalassobacter tenebrarum]